MRQSSLINDGIIVGELIPQERWCPYCKEVTRCVKINHVVMPEGIGVEATILWDKAEGKVIPRVGLGCGDYAKFHRQVAHIQDRMGRSRG